LLNLAGKLVLECDDSLITGNSVFQGGMEGKVFKSNHH